MSLFGVPRKRPEEYEGRPCQSFRSALKECLKESDCVRKERRKAKDCINNGRDYGTVPTRCFDLAAALTECNRSLDTTLKIITGEIYQEPPPQSKNDQSKTERSQN
ncbi:hypothetical protein DdX_15350 [Ditylenchus destructor]|uniref:Cytochrome c oxidase assembly factor 5 n=1 Tax=Ditylenchus destructor TaxID=166010 RepID=A0AAD4MRL4_9BILA|nr:hypothetical protein DdX_15350 [Ditylenchus destructor]